MTAGVVAFDWRTWSILYSSLASRITEQQALAFWPMAQLYCDNTPTSPICDLQQRGVLLGMMLAHIIVLNIGWDGTGASPLVGRVSTATEGSVTVSVENNYPAGTAQWYQTTTYGSQWYTATAQYRQFQYGAPPPYQADPYANLMYPGTFPYHGNN